MRLSRRRRRRRLLLALLTLAPSFACGGGFVDREADVIRMYHLEGKSYQEISSSCGLPENSIGPTLSRARAKLRQASMNPSTHDLDSLLSELLTIDPPTDLQADVALERRLTGQMQFGFGAGMTQASSGWERYH